MTFISKILTLRGYFKVINSILKFHFASFRNTQFFGNILISNTDNRTEILIHISRLILEFFKVTFKSILCICFEKISEN